MRKETGTPVIDFEYGRAALHDRLVPGSFRHVTATSAAQACGRDFFLSESDPHPSPKGHAVLADSLYSSLVESGIIGGLVAGAGGADDE